MNDKEFRRLDYLAHKEKYNQRDREYYQRNRKKIIAQKRAKRIEKNNKFVTMMHEAIIKYVESNDGKERFLQILDEFGFKMKEL